MFLDNIYDVLQGIDKKLDQLLKGQQTMSSAANTLAQVLANLQAEVANNTTVESSALTLVQAIPTMIQNAVTQALAEGATGQQLSSFNTLITQLQQNDTNLAAAVTVNTPAAATASSVPIPTPVGVNTQSETKTS
jgi:hypothetical protein